VHLNAGEMAYLTCLFNQPDVCVTVHHQYNDVSNQRNATTFSLIDLFKSDLHVSGDKFAHPQEHFLTVYKTFGTMCCNDRL
jgi:hypothetical protein